MPQPPLVLDPPAAPPAPPGLLSAALVLPMPEHGYNNGAIWQPDSVKMAQLNPMPCQAPPYTAFNLTGIEPVTQAWPVAVYASLVTAPIGYSDEEAVRRVRQRLLNTEQQLVEAAFWGGTATLLLLQQNYAGTVPGTAGGVGIAGAAGGVLEQIVAAGPNAGYDDQTATLMPGVTEAVSLLEQRSAVNYFAQATIHARPKMAAWFGRANQIRLIGLPPDAQKDMIYTQNWNKIVFGNGYPGTGPTRQAVDEAIGTGTEYMWATGRVIIWREDDMFVSPPDQLLDKTTNQRGLYAFRNYMIGIEGFATAVKLTRAI